MKVSVKELKLVLADLPKGYQPFGQTNTLHVMLNKGQPNTLNNSGYPFRPSSIKHLVFIYDHNLNDWVLEI